MTKLTIKCNHSDELIVSAKIATYYMNAKTYKFKHSYGWDEVLQDIDKALSDKVYYLSSMTSKEWQNKNYIVIRNKFGWAFGCEKVQENNNTVYYIRDAENCKKLTVIETSFTQNIKNKIQYVDTKKQPYSKYGLTVVQSQLSGKEVFNIKYHDSIISSEPITIIKDMGKKEPYGKYKLIAYCCINSMMYGLSSDGKLYNSNRSWKDCYTESLLTPHNCSQLIKEHIENYYCPVKHQEPSPTSLKAGVGLVFYFGQAPNSISAVFWR